VINEKKSTENSTISKSTTMRLPYYLRTLRNLLEQNVYRISSTDLAKTMNMTASQVRQDLSSLGAFGLKGYGYDTNTLYTSILDIAGIREEFSAVIIGSREMIAMLSVRPVFTRQGVALKNTFDTSLSDSLLNFEKYCTENPPDIIVLATLNPHTADVVDIIKKMNVKGVWNFSDVKLDLDVPVKNIWIDDSLMTLCFEISRNNF